MKEFPNAMQAIGWMFEQGLHLPTKDNKEAENERSVQLKRNKQGNRWTVEQIIEENTNDI